MNDFEKLGKFFEKTFYIDYYDSDNIYLGFKKPSSNGYVKISYSDFLFLKKYLDVVDCEDFQDEK